MQRSGLIWENTIEVMTNNQCNAMHAINYKEEGMLTVLAGHCQHAERAHRGLQQSSCHELSPP